MEEAFVSFGSGTTAWKNDSAGHGDAERDRWRRAEDGF